MYVYIRGKCWFTKCKSAQYHIGRANSNSSSVSAYLKAATVDSQQEGRRCIFATGLG